MPVYAKRLNVEQRRMLIEYEAISGYEPMGQEELDTGKISFSECWSKNVQFIEGVLAEVQNINTKGSGAYKKWCER